MTDIMSLPSVLSGLQEWYESAFDHSVPVLNYIFFFRKRLFGGLNLDHWSSRISLDSKASQAWAGGNAINSSECDCFSFTGEWLRFERKRDAHSQRAQNIDLTRLKFNLSIFWLHHCRLWVPLRNIQNMYINVNMCICWQWPSSLRLIVSVLLFMWNINMKPLLNGSCFSHLTWSLFH